jgi:hypothetical protein
MFLVSTGPRHMELTVRPLWERPATNASQTGGSSGKNAALLPANVVPTSPILVTLMMETLRSSETSVLTKATYRKIPEDDILHSHSPENLKSYITITGWTL